MTILIEEFKKLPDVIIHNIINYTDIVVYRNGKYINRILRQDKRYNVLKKIPIPIKVGLNKVILKLLNGNYDYIHGYVLEYNFQLNYIKLTMKFVVRETDGNDKYYDIMSNDTYIFDINNRWLRFINYSM